MPRDNTQGVFARFRIKGQGVVYEASGVILILPEADKSAVEVKAVFRAGGDVKFKFSGVFRTEVRVEFGIFVGHRCAARKPYRHGVGENFVTVHCKSSSRGVDVT